MAVIDFLPDRLNNPPVVWKGFTSGEFVLAAVIGVIAGIPLAIPLALVPFVGWLAFPTCMLLMPLLVIFLAATGLPATSAVSQKIISGNVWRNCAAVHVCPEP